jgi:hypothetical protein
MIKVVIIASGAAYQRAAAWAAGTFAIHSRNPENVSVLLPEREKVARVIVTNSQRFGFAVQRFPFFAKQDEHYTTKLKCAAFVWQMARIAPREIALFADADTCSLKPIRLAASDRQRIIAGKIGMSRDIVDRHFTDPSVPWYLTKKEQRPYVNSGIIFAGGKSLPFFECVRNLAMEPRFLTGPFNDQKVINFAIGKLSRKTLLVMDQRFNKIGTIEKDTIIAHFAGGAGLLHEHPRKDEHLSLCASVLGRFYKEKALRNKSQFHGLVLD